MNEIEFAIERESSSIIKAIGVGGAGCNAVNRMFEIQVKGVDFVICNTDDQVLQNSPVPIKIQLGKSLTEGRGAGNNPARGKEAAIENLADIEAILDNNTKMVFITAGMGGGTGTGAAPVIAAAAKKRDILTIGVVSIPFVIEGEIRIKQAIEGIKEMRKHVDALLIINNDKILSIFNDLKMSVAFSKADDILAIATKGIAEIITVRGNINVDFEDIKTIMKDSGVALMGSARANGEGRDLNAIKTALESPLLKDNDIKGAKHILLNIMSKRGDNELTTTEFKNITEYVIAEVGRTANVIWGTGFDDSLEDAVNVTIIATGFETQSELYENKKEKKIINVGNTISETIINNNPNDLYNNMLNASDIQTNVITWDNINKEEESSIVEPETNHADYGYLKDINKLNESPYLDNLEKVPAIDRIVKKENNDK